MGAKFVATAKYKRSTAESLKSQEKSFKFDASVSGWGVSANVGHS